jgi:hypothetical protein
MVAISTIRVEADNSAGIKNAEFAPKTLQLTEAEARSQAKRLHESLQVTLQTIHRKYHQQNQGMAIPAVALKAA